jgi:hypothetical protein
LSYSTAAEVLLGLASQAGVVLDGSTDDPVRRLLYVAAEACQRIDQAQADREAALLYAAELRALSRIAELPRCRSSKFPTLSASGWLTTG